MSFSTFFSNQARKPEGWFGRFVMRLIFDQGNALLNQLVLDQLSVQPGDYILDIGSGTGRLVSRLAGRIEDGYVEGIDFSKDMIRIARKRNKTDILNGRVGIIEDNFDTREYENGFFSKVCSVNTIYFWSDPERTVRKIAGILKPGGKLVLGFEDKEQLVKRNLNRDVFQFYSTDEVVDLLKSAELSNEVNQVTQKKGDQAFHCITAQKKG